MKKKFITFEGPEGSGKTSVIKAVVTALEKEHIDILTTREPGGIRISEDIRKIILSVDNKEMDARTEALLYAAARRQHIKEVIQPALNADKVVLCDRYIDSSLAYQGHGRNLGIDDVYALNTIAIDSLIPELTIFIDVPPSIGLKRVFSNGRKVDRLDLESIEFHERVYEGYQILIKKFPDRIKVVDGTKPIEVVVEDTIKLIHTLK
ncbi:MAG: dTMP kinase [Bacillota bacterium]